MRIVIVADSHLAAAAPECSRNWQAAADAAQRWPADLTIHLGDASLDGQSDREQLHFTAQLLRAWPTPLRCVPGNHDMGTGSGEEALDRDKLAACETALGLGCWSVRAGAWWLIGLNAQLLGSGTEEEARQWDWLEQRAAPEAQGAPVALFLHRPLVRPPHDTHMATGRYVTAAARNRLLGGPLRGALRCVFSGHTHQYLDRSDAGLRHVWLPSTAFVLPDALQQRVGEKLVGIGLLELEGTAMRFALQCPEGMQRLDAGTLSFWG